MKFGLIGLGKMGYNMVLNAMDNGHTVVAHNRSPASVKKSQMICNALKKITAPMTQTRLTIRSRVSMSRMPRSTIATKWKKGRTCQSATSISPPAITP